MLLCTAKFNWEYVVIFTKVLRHAKPQSPWTLRVLGPLQKLLLPLTFRSNVPFLVLLKFNNYDYLGLYSGACNFVNWNAKTSKKFLGLRLLTVPNDKVNFC